jgi:hypothetical protein
VPPEIGHCHAALGRIAARLGEKATAAQQLASAQLIFK